MEFAAPWMRAKIKKWVYRVIFCVVVFYCYVLVKSWEAYGYQPDDLHLDIIYLCWQNKGRPSDFNPANCGGTFDPPIITFTNAVTNKGKIYRCLFGLRYNSPPGFFAMTDSGVTVFIRDKDSKVFISPDKYGGP